MFGPRPAGPPEGAAAIPVVGTHLPATVHPTRHPDDGPHCPPTTRPTRSAPSAETSLERMGGSGGRSPSGRGVGVAPPQDTRNDAVRAFRGNVTGEVWGGP